MGLLLGFCGLVNWLAVSGFGLYDMRFWSVVCVVTLGCAYCWVFC